MKRHSARQAAMEKKCRKSTNLFFSRLNVLGDAVTQHLEEDIEKNTRRKTFQRKNNVGNEKKM